MIIKLGYTCICIKVNVTFFISLNGKINFMSTCTFD